MKHKLTTLILIVISIINVHAATKTITTKNFVIQYDGSTENYAKASLKILEIVKKNAVKLGFYFPKKVELHIIKSDRHMLYVRGDNPNLITYEYKSIKDFLAPEKSGYHNVYGLCHEMGHVCMGNITPHYNWMTVDYSEGWANYFGCLMVENVYKSLGVEAWPNQHNYHKSRGLQAFLKGINDNKSKENIGFFYCSLFWYNLGKQIEKSNICNFMVSLKVSNINKADCEIKYLDLLKMYKLNSEFIENFRKNKNYLLNTTQK